MENFKKTDVKIAAEKRYIKQDDIQGLIKFRNNSSDESWKSLFIIMI